MHAEAPGLFICLGTACLQLSDECLRASCAGVSVLVATTLALHAASALYATCPSI